MVDQMWIHEEIIFGYSDKDREIITFGYSDKDKEKRYIICPLKNALHQSSLYGNLYNAGLNKLKTNNMWDGFDFVYKWKCQYEQYLEIAENAKKDIGFALFGDNEFGIWENGIIEIVCNYVFFNKNY